MRKEEKEEKDNEKRKKEYDKVTVHGREKIRES